jgi:ABC-type polysaccharide transport system permease subunit
MNQFSGLKRSYQKNRRYKQLYLLALIPFLFVLIFNYVPMSGILLAFKDYSIRKGIIGSPWAGFKYFRQLFSIPIFPTILKNTIILSLESMLFSFPFPIILALAFNEIRNAKLKKVFQTISFAPYFISTVVVVSIIFQMFSYRYGVINSFVQTLGFESVNFTGLSGFFKPSYIISGIWQGAGYSSILYIAALASVDLSLYEAAAIDGASRFQKVLHVDLPCITPTIVITLILSAGNILSIGFEKVYLLQNPANYNVSEIIATYVYKTGIEQAQFSFSTAVGLFNAIVNCIMLLIVNMIANKVSETSLF